MDEIDERKNFKLIKITSLNVFHVKTDRKS